jgi:hypothetical protein
LLPLVRDTREQSPAPERLDHFFAGIGVGYSDVEQIARGELTELAPLARTISPRAQKSLQRGADPNSAPSCRVIRRNVVNCDDGVGYRAGLRLCLRGDIMRVI